MRRRTCLLLLLLLFALGLLSTIYKRNRELANDTRTRYDVKQRQLGDHKQHKYDSKNQALLGGDTTTKHERRENTPAAVMTSVPICTSRQRLDYIRARISRNATRPSPKLNNYILAEDRLYRLNAERLNKL